MKKEKYPLKVFVALTDEHDGRPTKLLGVYIAKFESEVRDAIAEVMMIRETMPEDEAKEFAEWRVKIQEAELVNLSRETHRKIPKFVEEAVKRIKGRRKI